MKKHIRLAALLMAFALILCACGSGNNSNNTNNSNNSNSSESGSTFDRSAGLDENGYWKDIKATDYVTIPDLSKVTVSKEDIQKEIDILLTKYPNMKEVKDRAVKDGDTINIDYTGKIDGVAFDGGSTNGQGSEVTIGQDKFIDDLLERMVGHMPGETFDLDATFPDPYEQNTDLSGKKSVFTVTINYILEPTETVWNDEFVAMKLYTNYGWSTTAEAENGIKAALAEDAVAAACTFNKDMPEVIVNYQTESAIEYYKGYAAQYGIDVETLMQSMMGYASLDAFREAYKENAIETTKFYMIYQALAESKDYKVSTDEIKAYFKDMTGSDDYARYEEAFGLPYIKAMIMYEKMSQIIRDTVTIA